MRSSDRAQTRDVPKVWSATQWSGFRSTAPSGMGIPRLPFFPPCERLPGADRARAHLLCPFRARNFWGGGNQGHAQGWYLVPRWGRRNNDRLGVESGSCHRNKLPIPRAPKVSHRLVPGNERLVFRPVRIDSRSLGGTSFLEKFASISLTFTLRK